MTRHPALPERDRRILGVLVQAYIDQGEPVSSLWLASRGFGVSSATLRNVLARLEEQGYVRQPHTSAGRVPTDMGYRAYVDQFMAERRASRPGPQVEARLRQAGTVEDLLSHVSHEVSRASHHVGFAIAPAANTARLEHLEFVPLDGGKILVIIVAGRHISHKVVETTEAEAVPRRTFLGCLHSRSCIGAGNDHRISRIHEAPSQPLPPRQGRRMVAGGEAQRATGWTGRTIAPRQGCRK